MCEETTRGEVAAVYNALLHNVTSGAWAPLHSSIHLMLVFVISCFASCTAVCVIGSLEPNLLDVVAAIMVHVFIGGLVAWALHRQRLITRDEMLRSLAMRSLEVLAPYLDLEQQAELVSTGIPSL